MDSSLEVSDEHMATLARTNNLQTNKEELKCLLQSVKLCKNKCLRNTVILESLKECLCRSEKLHMFTTKVNKLPVTVANKVAMVLWMERLYGDTRVKDIGKTVQDGSVNLLGLSQEIFASGNSGLLESDKHIVRAVGEQHLLEKQHCHQLKKFTAVTEKTGDNDSEGRSTTEFVLSGLVQQNYVILENHWTELKRLLDLRQHFLQQILPQKVACLESQLEMCQAQKRCLDKGLLEFILYEVPKFPKALKLVYKKMREDNEALVLEIDRLNNLQAEYKKLKGTKFDMLVLDYINILKKIEHTNWGLHNLK